MKTIKLLFFLLLTTLSYSQYEDNISLFEINSEPMAESFGKRAFNIGIEFEYFGDIGYINPGIYLFPNLNGVGYTQIHSSGGLNKRLGIFKEHRIYTGVMLGINIREGNRNPIAGLEAGYEYYLSKDIGLGVGGNILKRGDAEFYDGKPYVFSGQVKIKIIIFRK